MLPAYLAVGLLNVFAQHNNYEINFNNTEMDIKVRRDTQETDGSTNPHLIFTDPIQSHNTDRVREKQQWPPHDYNHNNKNSPKVNATDNTNWRNDYVWNKIKGHEDNGIYNSGNNGSGSNNVPVSSYRNGTRRHTSQHTIMPRYNMTEFKSDILFPGSNYNSTTYNRHTLQFGNTNAANYQPGIPILSNYNTASNATAVTGNGPSTPVHDIKPVTPVNGSKSSVNGKKRVKRACAICDMPCPAGTHRDQSGQFCIPDDYW